MAKRTVLVLSRQEDNTRYETLFGPLKDKYDVDILITSPANKEEFMSLFRDKSRNIVVIANSWWNARDMGGYTDETLEELAELGTLKAICHLGAGYEVVGDIDTYKRLGKIQVSNTPSGVSVATANTAIYLLLAAMRLYNAQQTSLRKGTWALRDLELPHDPRGQVLGILGMGSIGQLIRDRARPFGFKRIQYYSRNKLGPEDEQDTVYTETFDKLLETSDCIVIVVPLNKSTHHLIDAKALEKCKDKVTIVNVARGAVIDEDALVKALQSGKVWSVGLDVYEHEPKIHPGLLENDRVTLLPHIGAFTQESFIDADKERLANVESFLKTGKVQNLVPELRGLF